MQHQHNCSHDHNEPAKERTSSALSGQYTCPMHPEVLEDQAGDCPSCGMALEPLSLDRNLLEDDTELRDMLRLFWISVPFTAGVLVLSMGEMIPGIEFVVGLAMIYLRGVKQRSQRPCCCGVVGCFSFEVGGRLSITRRTCGR